MADNHSATVPNSTVMFKEAWELFRDQIWTWIGISIVPSILSALVFGVYAIPIGDSLFSVGLSIVLFIAAAIFQVWSQAALIEAAHHSSKKISIQEAYRGSWPKLGGFIGLSILISLITSGGLALFIIPGIILIVSFVLAPYVYMIEGKNGMAALVQSRAYLKAKDTNIVRHIVFLALASMIISLVFGFLAPTSPTISSSNQTIEFVANIILSVIVTPLVSLYMYKVYTHARKVAGHIDTQVETKTKAFYIFLAILGPIAFVGFFSAIIYAFINVYK